MLIIRIQANENGSRPPIQEWPMRSIPDGYAAIPAAVCTDVFYKSNGFVNLDVSDADGWSVVVAMTKNTEAWEAWKESQTEEETEEAGESNG